MRRGEAAEDNGQTWNVWNLRMSGAADTVLPPLQGGVIIERYQKLRIWLLSFGSFAAGNLGSDAIRFASVLTLPRFPVDHRTHDTFHLSGEVAPCGVTGHRIRDVETDNVGGVKMDI